MKRKSTKEIIADSFLELAASKAINKISIIDIVENCSVTKPTFYRYFKDKYDLISWIYVREAQTNVDKIGDGGYLWRDTLLDGLRFYERNRKFMVNALMHTSGRGSFIHQINEADIAFITAQISKKQGGKQVPEELIRMVKVYCYGTGQFLCEWLMDLNPIPAEEAAETMEACIPGALKPYLCE